MHEALHIPHLTPSAPALLAAAPPVIGGAPGPAPAGSPAAQAAPSGVIGGPAGAPQAAPPGAFNSTFLFLMLGMIVLMIVMSVMQGRREKKARAQLMADLGRHDRVQTIGGVIGTIVELKDDEIVLKVDESNNTRIHVARSAVQSVLRKKSNPDSAARSEEPAAAGARS